MSKAVKKTVYSVDRSDVTDSEILNDLGKAWTRDQIEENVPNVPNGIHMVVIGETGVGKTSLILQYLSDAEFAPGYPEDIPRTMSFRRNILKVTDVDGRKKYSQYRELATDEADVVIAVFSWMDPRSLVELENWDIVSTAISKRARDDVEEEDPAFVLVGTMRDGMDSKVYDTSRTQAKALAKKLGCRLVEAKVDQGSYDAETLFVSEAIGAFMARRGLLKYPDSAEDTDNEEAAESLSADEKEKEEEGDDSDAEDEKMKKMIFQAMAGFVAPK